MRQAEPPRRWLFCVFKLKLYVIKPFLQHCWLICFIFCSIWSPWLIWLFQFKSVVYSFLNFLWRSYTCAFGYKTFFAGPLFLKLPLGKFLWVKVPCLHFASPRIFLTITVLTIASYLHTGKLLRYFLRWLVLMLGFLWIKTKVLDLHALLIIHDCSCILAFFCFYFMIYLFIFFILWTNHRSPLYGQV